MKTFDVLVRAQAGPKEDLGKELLAYILAAGNVRELDFMWDREPMTLTVTTYGLYGPDGSLYIGYKKKSGGPSGKTLTDIYRWLLADISSDQGGQQ